jgi:hypothetical protein
MLTSEGLKGPQRADKLAKPACFYETLSGTGGGVETWAF